MQILRDFVQFENNEKSASSIIEKLENDRKEINKQIHIFKVLDVANKIQELFDDGTFEENELVAIDVHYKYDRDYGNQIKYNLHYEDGEVSAMFLSNDLTEKIELIFRVLEGFRVENISDEFNKAYTTHKILVEESFKDKFTELLLSTELRKILDYSRLDSDLPKNNIKDKRKKI